MYSSEFPLLAVAPDALLTIGFYTATPLIILIHRKHNGSTDKLYLPGGHFDPGLWHKATEQFAGHPLIENIRCDPSLRICLSRECGEEIHVSQNPNDWTFVIELDAPDRDPRSDMRRISLAYWQDLAATPKGLKADSDVESYQITELMNLTPASMGFDHWRAIEILQKKWLVYSRIWTFVQNTTWIHTCVSPNQIPPEHSILINNQIVSIALRVGAQTIELKGAIKACPFCGADLTLPPPV
jgi:ADP-ribose pyrophosphatase YjhB (NUDIX family)